jgi:hypothetical protein
MLGRYSSSGCRDTPTSLTPITEDRIKTCLNTDGVSSVSLWCTGEIVALTPRLPNGPKAPLVRPQYGGGRRDGESTLGWEFWVGVPLAGLFVFGLLVMVLRAFGIGEKVRRAFRPKYGRIAL